MPAFDDWYWVMAYPGIKVSTAQARAILPKQYDKADIINHGRYLSGFIHACHTQQPKLAASLMKDVIAEPYRTQLLPGFDKAREAALQKGALACFLLLIHWLLPKMWRNGYNNIMYKTMKALYTSAV